MTGSYLVKKENESVFKSQKYRNIKKQIDLYSISVHYRGSRSKNRNLNMRFVY